MIAGVDNKWVEMPNKQTKNKRQQVSGEDIDEETKDDVEVTFENVIEEETKDVVEVRGSKPKSKSRKRIAPQE